MSGPQQRIIRITQDLQIVEIYIQTVVCSPNLARLIDTIHSFKQEFHRETETQRSGIAGERGICNGSNAGK